MENLLKPPLNPPPTTIRRPDAHRGLQAPDLRVGLALATRPILPV